MQAAWHGTIPARLRCRRTTHRCFDPGVEWPVSLRALGLGPRTRPRWGSLALDFTQNCAASRQIARKAYDRQETSGCASLGTKIRWISTRLLRRRGESATAGAFALPSRSIFAPRVPWPLSCTLVSNWLRMPPKSRVRVSSPPSMKFCDMRSSASAACAEPMSTVARRKRTVLLSAELILDINVSLVTPRAGVAISSGPMTTPAPSSAAAGAYSDSSHRESVSLAVAYCNARKIRV
jgi:hypothetical protein